MNLSELNWRRSSRCDSGTCVEVAFDGNRVHIRSSTEPWNELELAFSEWDTFVAGVLNGEFRG